MLLPGSKWDLLHEGILWMPSCNTGIYHLLFSPAVVNGWLPTFEVLSEPLFIIGFLKCSLFLSAAHLTHLLELKELLILSLNFLWNASSPQVSSGSTVPHHQTQSPGFWLSAEIWPIQSSRSDKPKWIHWLLSTEQVSGIDPDTSFAIILSSYIYVPPDSSSQ